MHLKDWNASYSKGENHIFYPHEELVRFINRYITKRRGIDQFEKHPPFSGDRQIAGLDFGCGVGAGFALMEEFGIDSFGVDISENAISIAKKFNKSRGDSIDKKLINIVPDQKLNFQDHQFDFFVSCCVLDSMPFKSAKFNITELSRVIKHYGYISLISGDNLRFFGEKIVQDGHEKGTIQSYFNYQKCLDLVENTGLKIKECELIYRSSITQESSQILNGRYHLILEKY